MSEPDAPHAFAVSAGKLEVLGCRLEPGCHLTGRAAAAMSTAAENLWMVAAEFITPDGGVAIGVWATPQLRAVASGSLFHTVNWSARQYSTWPSGATTGFWGSMADTGAAAAVMAAANTTDWLG